MVLGTPSKTQGEGEGEGHKLPYQAQVGAFLQFELCSLPWPLSLNDKVVNVI